MRPERDGALTEVRATATQVSPTSEQTTAQARITAVAVNLSAMAAGKWDVSPALLAAMAHLSWAAAFDLELEWAS